MGLMLIGVFLFNISVNLLILIWSLIFTLRDVISKIKKRCLQRKNKVTSEIAEQNLEVDIVVDREFKQIEHHLSGNNMA